MRFLFGVGSKMFIWDTSVTKVTMRVAGSSDAEDDEEFEQAPPVDPHGTLSSHCELSPQAVFEGGSARRFGFGSEVSGT